MPESAARTVSPVVWIAGVSGAAIVAFGVLLYLRRRRETDVRRDATPTEGGES